MPRLNRASLGSLPAAIARPGYDLGAVETGIVHLGLGAFHRAHEAVYTDAALAGGDLRWGILGASLRSPDSRDALAPQDGLYALEAGEALSVIGSVRGLVLAPENPAALLAAMAAPFVKIVSLTVTEKGYCHDPATGNLNPDHSDIEWDLANPLAPRSAPGFIVRALAKRRAAGLPPFTVLTCDNLPHNGRTVRNVVVQLARLMDPELAKFIEAEVAFPATMVDRIVPATTDADRARISAALGVTDAWPIVTEPFTQWVIEDHFPQGRPDWAAQFTNDVAAWETMKLRLLNGAHSSLAYLGYLSGRETVAEAMVDEAMARFVRRLMDEEVTPVLRVPAGADVPAYKDALITRFRNPALKHRTWQIAMDGSQKLPQRLLGTVRDRLAAGASVTLLAHGVAAWMRYVSGMDEKGQPIDVRDPMAAELKRRAGEGTLLDVQAIFGTDLPANETFRAAVNAAFQSLTTKGAAATLRELV